MKPIIFIFFLLISLLSLILIQFNYVRFFAYKWFINNLFKLFNVI